MNKNIHFKELITKLEAFEKKFKQGTRDVSLIAMLQESFDTLKKANFSEDELLEINSKLLPFRQMFADENELLKNQSANLLKTKTQLDRYIINSNIKTK